MADRTSRLIVRLIDGVSGPAAAAATGLRRLLGVSERAAVAQRGTMAAAGRDLGMIRRGTERMTSGMAIPLALIGAYGAKAAYEFAKAGNDMQAVTLMSDENRTKLEAHAKALNALFPATNSQIMGAAFELGRAGLNFEQIMGALKGTLQLGLAGDLGLAEAADISTNILTAMRLPQKTTEQVEASLMRVNDVLSYVATNSNTDVRMMGETLKYVGPMAAAAGLSLEQVGAASMVMAKNGIRASEAGVAMRSGLVRMVRPTKPMLAALSRLNLEVSDFVKGGRQISAMDVIGSLMSDGVDASAFEAEIDAALADPKLKKSTAAMTAAIAGIIEKGGSAVDKSKLAESITDTLHAAGSEVDFFGFIKALQEKGADLGDISRIFDVRQGSRLATLLAGDLAKALDEVSNKATGATDRMARLRTKGIVGEVLALSSAWENLFVAIGESGVMATASDLIGRLANALEGLAKSSPKLLKFGTYAAITAIALVPLGMAVAGLAGAIGLATGGIGLLLTGVAAIGAIPALVGVAVIGAGIAIWYFWGELKAAGERIWQSLSNWAANSKEALGRMVDHFRNLGSEISSAIKEGSAELFKAGVELIKQLWEGMKSMAGDLLSWAGGLASNIGSRIANSLGFGGGDAPAASGGADLPGRSGGGRVSQGRSYIVGERRPEIFTPGASGYITPRVPEGGGAPAVNVTNHLTINGATDVEAVTEKVRRAISEGIREAMRGAQGDLAGAY